MNNVYPCPGPHDGSLNIHFNKILMPFNQESAALLTPSVPNPGDYNHLQLVQKNLAWSGVDVIKAWNNDDAKDAVIYLGKWSETDSLIDTTT